MIHLRGSQAFSVKSVVRCLRGVPEDITEGSGDGTSFRKVDVRLPGKGDSNSHGARPVHLIITMIKWIRTVSNSTRFCCQPLVVAEGKDTRVLEGVNSFKGATRCAVGF